MALKTEFAARSSVTQQTVEEHTLPLSNSVKLRVYSSTRPHNQKIAQLQKGLILIAKGVETVGEGTGFGLPVLVYASETCFSGSSTVEVFSNLDAHVITKHFSMDRVGRNTFRNFTLENRTARNFIDRLSTLYQNHEHFRFLALKGLTQRLGIDKTFRETVSKGEVSVRYTVDKKCITVEADFSNVERNGLRRIFILNEQSASFFREYVDQEGAKLLEDEIGAWGLTRGEWAVLKHGPDGLGFRLWKVDGSTLRRGRETLENSLDWVGLDYEVNPKREAFSYVIEIVGL